MGFSAKQLLALRQNVDRRNLRNREVENGRVLTYIEGWHAIAEANRIFGFENWDRETVETKCVLARELRGEFTTIYLARVRITVRADGMAVTREGHGTGTSKGLEPGEAHDKALKAAETDATKRALATFGKPFGLSLYLSSNSRFGQKRSNGAQRRTARGVTPALQAPMDSGRRRTRQVLGSNGRYYVPPRTEPTSNVFHAILANDNTEPTGGRAPGENDTSDGNASMPGGQVNANAAPAIGDVELLIAHPRRLRDRDHLAFVAKQPCLVCGRIPADAHHLRFAQPRALGRKVSDEFTVPVCRTHHRQLHHAGDEAAWWTDLDIDPLPIAQDLWAQTRRSGDNPSTDKPADEENLGEPKPNRR